MIKEEEPLVAIKDIQGFYGLLEKNDGRCKELSEKVLKIKNEEDLKNFLKTEVMPIVKEKKLNLELQDFLDYEEETMSNLNLKDIKDVRGGISAKPILKAGGIMSILFLGAGLGNSTRTDATVPLSAVTESTDKITKDEDSKRQNKTHVDDIFDDFGIEISGDEISRDEAMETSKEKSTNQEDINEESFEQPIEEITETTDDIIKESYKFKDKKYVIEALNLVDPCINNITGITENYRLYNGAIKNLEIKSKNANEQETRFYVKDQGDDSLEFMKKLFPSSSGKLNVGGVGGFKNECNPDAKFLADVVCYFHNEVRENMEQSKKDLEILSEVTTKDEIRKALVFSKIYGILNNTSKLKIIFSDDGNIVNCIKAWRAFGCDEPVSFTVSSLLKLINPKSQDENVFASLKQYYNRKTQRRGKVTGGDVIKALQNFLPLENFFELPINSNNNNDNNDNNNIDSSKEMKYKLIGDFDKRFKGVLKLLNFGANMIKQEGQCKGGITPWEIIPKYTVEKMLMSYFLEIQEEKEAKASIDSFYRRIEEKLKSSSEDEVYYYADLYKDVVDLKNRNKFLKKIKYAYNSPYKSATVANGDTYQISKVNDGTVRFQGGKFADCADITVRHVINLLCYDKSEGWNKVLPKSKEERAALAEKLSEVKNAINSTGDRSVTFYDFKTRLQIFFLHQEEVGADASDLVTRSLWNYAISNLNEEDNLKKGYYKNSYVKINYELTSGLLNSLKLTYNIAKALNLGTEESQETAKEAIDSLKGMKINNEFYVADTIKKVYGLLGQVDNVVANQMNSFLMELYGDFSIEGNSNEFNLVQDIHHAAVYHNPLKEINIDNIYMMNFLNDDEMSEILACHFGCRVKKLGLSLFNGFYSDALDQFYLEFNEDRVNEKFFEDIVLSSNYYNNYRALKFLKAVQGETDYMTIMSEYKANKFDLDKLDIQVSLGNGKETSLKDYIIQNYIKGMDFEFIKNNFLYLGETFGEFLYRHNIANATKIGEMDYYYLIIDKDGKETVDLYPMDSNITKFTLPRHVIIDGKSYDVNGIAPYAFTEFEKLEEFNIEDGFETLDIGNSAFYGCLQLSQFIVPASVKILNIDDSAFEYCENLRRFVFPAAVTTLNIGAKAFYECEYFNSSQTDDVNFGKFIIPESVTTLNIGNCAFGECSIRTFTIKSNLTNFTIGSKAFYDCIELERFEILGVVKNLNIACSAFMKCKKLKKFVIPKDLINLNIDKSAFEHCVYLKKFVIPEGVATLTIDQSAFHDCTNLKNFTVPKSVTNLIIGCYAFASCTSLKDVNIKGEFETLTISDYAFSLCEKLENIVIPESVKYLNICNFAFSGCSSLRNFNNEDNLETLMIKNYAFENSKVLESFTVPEKVKSLSIDNFAFAGCSSLEEFNVKCKLETLLISDYAFEECKSLRSVTFSATIENLIIGKNAFFECESLNKFAIPEGIKSLIIYVNAFARCRSLTRFELVANKTSLTISNFAFDNCINLKEFSVKGSLSAYDIGELVFNRCVNLKTIIIPNVDIDEFQITVFKWVKVN